MGLKTDSHPTNSRPKMNPRDAKIKQIVETTRCTHSEAEEALAENNNELEAAVSWILDHTGDNVWTESKTRKAKKADVVVEEQPQQRPERPPRGNNVWSESKTRKTKRTFEGKKPEPPQVAATPAPSSSSAAPKPVLPAATTPVKPVPVMKNAAGPLSFAAICARGEKKPEPPQVAAAPAPLSSSAAPKPVSPAATTPVKPVQSPQVATSSTAKEPSPAPHETPVKPSLSKPEPVTPEPPVERFTDSNTVQSLTSQLKNDLGLGSTPPKHVSSPSSNLISTSASPANTVPTRGIVEFVSDLNTNKSYDYHFGFNPESSTNVEESSFKSSNNSASVQNDYRSQHENDVYKTSNVDSSPAGKPIASAVSQLSNSYGMQPPQQQQQAPHSTQQQQQQQPRRTAFGYAETSTVSYPPESRPSVNTTPAAPATTTPALSNYSKPAVTAQSSYNHNQHPQQMQQQPLHQQHTSQQQMFNPLYTGYPYMGMNLYSPVAGREDQPYASPYHMPYAAYQMDMVSQMMPQMHAMHAAVPGHHQQQQQTTHRPDHHQAFNDMKQNYTQNAPANPNAATVNPSGQRDANISSANVPPPPGFSGPPGNHMFPSQHGPPMFNYAQPMFMKTVPNQMYGGQQNVEDSMDIRHQTQAKMYGQQENKFSNGSNVRDRMAMGNTAQPTPPPTQGGYGGQQPNSYAGNGQMNSVLNSKKQFQHPGNQWTN